MRKKNIFIISVALIVGIVTIVISYFVLKIYTNDNIQYVEITETSSVNQGSSLDNVDSIQSRNLQINKELHELYGIPEGYGYELTDENLVSVDKSKKIYILNASKELGKGIFDSIYDKYFTNKNTSKTEATNEEVIVSSERNSEVLDYCESTGFLSYSFTDIDTQNTVGNQMTDSEIKAIMSSFLNDSGISSEERKLSYVISSITRNELNQYTVCAEGAYEGVPLTCSSSVVMQNETIGSAEIVQVSIKNSKIVGIVLMNIRNINSKAELKSEKVESSDELINILRKYLEDNSNKERYYKYCHVKSTRYVYIPNSDDVKGISIVPAIEISTVNEIYNFSNDTWSKDNGTYTICLTDGLMRYTSNVYSE